MMKDDHPQTSTQEKTITSGLDVVSNYVAALMAQDNYQMAQLQAPDFVLDWVYGDAFENDPMTPKETQQFWSAWFAGFPEMDFEVTRTIAADAVVVIQWIFTGTHTVSLEPPIFKEAKLPTGRTIRFRGVSVYDVANNLIQRETTYLDLATLVVELEAKV